LELDGFSVIREQHRESRQAARGPPEPGGFVDTVITIKKPASRHALAGGYDWTPHAAAINGTENGDVIDGTPDADVIYGLGGADDIDGHGGDDVIWGGDGADDIIGGTAGEDELGAGDDELHGGEGNDRLADTDGGNDELYGEAGDDELDYQGGYVPDIVQVLLDGGTGDDVLRFSTQGFETLATLTGGDGHDQIQSGGGGHVQIDAGADSDFIQILNFETHYDISLGTGADLLMLYSFTFEPAESDVTVTVADFAAGDGGDALLLLQYLPWVLHGWDLAANPFATGHLRLEQRGADTAVQLDRDAAGADWGFVDLVVLKNVAPGSLTAHNLGGYAPGGAATAGTVVTGTAARDFLADAAAGDEVYGLGGNDTLFGGAGDDLLDGGDGDDTLDGELGNDELRGGEGRDLLADAAAGDDELYGEGGNDFLIVDRQAFPAPAGNVLLDGGAGDDTLVYMGRALTGDATLRGGADDDLIRAFGGGAVVIDGGDGAERITIDVSAQSYAITFGASAQDSDILELAYTSAPVTAFTILDFTAGNGGDMIEMESFLEAYLFDWDGIANPFTTGHLLLAQSGADALILVDRNGGGDGYAVLGTLENINAASLTALNVDFLPGPVAIAGTSGDDGLVGTAGADFMLGFLGDDVLNGLGGADRLEGGGGDDTYYVDSSNDVVVENEDEGRDTVYTTVNYTLAEGTYVEALSTNSIAGTAAINLAGNGFNNEIYGNNGANLLNGGGGAGDYLVGWGGDDVYLIFTGAEIIVENVNGGRDVVYTTVSYGLAAGSQIEVLSTDSIAGTNAINLTGNGLNNEIYGNNGANMLNGGGGAGDYLVGWGGDDVYLIFTGGEIIIENVNGGRDVVYSTVSYGIAAGTQVEVLSTDSIAGTNAINLTGNGLNNEIYGNNGANTLNGGGGAGDYLVGWGGDDTYLIFTGGEIIIENAGGGRDVVYSTVSYALAAGTSVEVLSTNSIGGTTGLSLTGNELGQEVYGNNGANTLNGGAGGDYLAGFGGADSFAFTTALGSGNVDHLADFSAVDDTILLENAVFTGLANGALAPGAFVAGSAAADADDRIVYNSATGQIFFDADGNGAGAQVLFATVNAGTILTASDFMVI
jgi:Ca2+-binding RTX toxin-like protein